MFVLFLKSGKYMFPVLCSALTLTFCNNRYKEALLTCHLTWSPLRHAISREKSCTFFPFTQHTFIARLILWHSVSATAKLKLTLSLKSTESCSHMRSRRSFNIQKRKLPCICKSAKYSNSSPLTSITAVFWRAIDWRLNRVCIWWAKRSVKISWL